ncbi:MAG: AAA family ATPase, partial [Pseudomonadota bacterium]
TRMLIGIDGIQPTTSIKDVLLAKDAKQAIKNAIIHQTAIKNVHLVPSTLRLAAIENELFRNSTLRSPCTYLRKCLPSIEDNYDFCLIDVPPALSTLTGNALFAANYVVVPFSAGDRYGFEGVNDLVAYIRDAQEQDVNPNLQILGAVVLNFNIQEIAHAMTESAISDHFDVLAKIPRSAAIQKSSIEGKTVLQAERSSSAARAFVQLTRSIVEKIGVKPRRVLKKSTTDATKGETRG